MSFGWDQSGDVREYKVIDSIINKKKKNQISAVTLKTFFCESLIVLHDSFPPPLET